MGSVKDLVEHLGQDGCVFGEFIFSDRYSVFDYGEMPDLIPNKGAALAIIAACAFERLEKTTRIKSHYKGLISQNRTPVFIESLENSTDTMMVNLVRVKKPEFSSGVYDYSQYKVDNLKNLLIPFEFIYRNKLPKGSSVFLRLEKGLLNYKDLRLDHMPVFGEVLPKPFFEITTKLERTDRFVTFDQVRGMIGVSNEEIYEMILVLSQVEKVVSTMTNEVGLSNDDGKIELAFNSDGEIIVVDVFGTPDECRFSYQGIQLSKEILRQYYMTTPWYDEIKIAKEKAKNVEVEDWQQFCPKPDPLPQELINLVSMVYKSMANAFLGRKIFADVPDLPEIAEIYVEFWNRFQRHS
ncbi:MAG: phosphoribosylaminoimidazolesuccinocarboxamide synthase [Candidatus Shapirobacteria bacterium]|jgi:phosphoribosylaminoimidazole-succinocarboxamide synthase